MALKTVSQLKDSVAAILSGVDLSNIDDLNGAIERGARILVQKADIPEASAVQNIVLYSGVYDYPCDSRIFGTAITDIRPQGISRPPSDYVYKKPGEQFDRTKEYFSNGTMATFEYINGAPIIRIVSKTSQQQITLDTMSETSGWTAAGTASGLTQDTAVYYQTPASLRFLLSGTGTGTITKTLSSPLSMASYENVGVAFLAIRIPDGATATNLTSISLKIGSSASDYDLVSNTAGFLGAWTAGNWMLVAFDFATAVSTGTPDWAAIDYLQVSLAHTGTFTNFRVGGLFICQPNPAQILFQSAAIFKAANATASTSITQNTDEILLNDPAYTLFQFEAALEILQSASGGMSDSTMAKIKQRLDGNGVNDFGLYGYFRGDNPSQEIRTVGNYYDDGTDSMRGYGSMY